jgi:peptide deformylase
VGCGRSLTGVEVDTRVILKIRKYGDPVLREAAEPVAEVDDEIVKLIENMTETMYAAEGLGLAANQVGVLKRVIIIDEGMARGEDKNKILALVNPEIVLEEGSALGNEGCLSFPELRGDIYRPQRVVVQGLDKKGKAIKVEGIDLLARAIRHEVDHLNGVLFIDKMVRSDKELIKGKLRKLRKETLKELKRERAA